MFERTFPVAIKKENLFRSMVCPEMKKGIRSFIRKLDKNHPLYFYDFKHGDIIIDNDTNEYYFVTGYCIKYDEDDVYDEFYRLMIHLIPVQVGKQPKRSRIIIDLRVFYSKSEKDENEYKFTLSDKPNLICHHWLDGDFMFISNETFKDIQTLKEDVE